MRIEVDHLTTYSYSDPVALGRHTVRLRPRPDGRFLELGYSLRSASVRMARAWADTE